MESYQYASMVRPVKELAGFVRVTPAPGERRRVTFRVCPGQMAFVDSGMRWKIEHGRVLVEVGASSEDIRLRSAYQVTADAFIHGRDRALWAEASIEK